MSDSSQPQVNRETILHLDENLNLLALQEAIQLLTEQLDQLRRHGQMCGPLQTLAHQARTRLLFLALQCRCPELDRATSRALARESQDYLTRFTASQRFQAFLHSHNP